jgi:putative transcriptional regulator
MGLVRLRIRELAKERGWTLKEVSNRSGVNYSTIKTYATSSGMAMADVSALMRLLKVFDVSIEDLVEVIEE